MFLVGTKNVEIEKTAQMILDAREKYSDSTFADLYHQDSMSAAPELKKAHDLNNSAVMKAYGFFNIGERGQRKFWTEGECVAELMKMYQALVN